MDFRFEDALPLLRRTPATLRALLEGLPPSWVEATEGPDTWSPCDVVGHLILSERVTWIPRAEHLLRHGDSRPFVPFDGEAISASSDGLSLAERLDSFAELRATSLERLEAFRLTEADLARRGSHPELGSVTLGQLLASWIVHDLGHLGQIGRTMARQYTETVGPWRRYLSILGSPSG